MHHGSVRMGRRLARFDVWIRKRRIEPLPSDSGGDMTQNASDFAGGDSIEISDANLKLASTLGIAPTIHKLDHIYGFHKKISGNDAEIATSKYYRIGKYSADLLKDVIEYVVKSKSAMRQEWGPNRILDFASGYGCAARHLPIAFPTSLNCACDIHPAAVDFMRDALKISSYVSSSVPERLNIPVQDFIFALSFFSHMPDTTYKRWLSALAQHLAPGGVLLFTANGHVSERAGGTPGVTVAKYGFGFRPQSEQHDLEASEYGLTVSHPVWVIDALNQVPNLRLARFQEGFWWGRQDLYVCVREL